MTKPYTALQAAKDLISGKLKMTTPEVAQERMDICNGCEAQNKTTRMCTACGCFLPAKTRLAESSCPMELWLAVDPD